MFRRTNKKSRVLDISPPMTDDSLYSQANISTASLNAVPIAAAPRQLPGKITMLPAPSVAPYASSHAGTYTRHTSSYVTPGSPASSTRTSSPTITSPSSFESNNGQFEDAFDPLQPIPYKTLPNLLSRSGPGRRAPPPPLSAPRLDDIANITYLDLSSMTAATQVIATTGRLPLWLQKCTALEVLVAKDLGITVLDDWVSSCMPNLRVVRLANNQIGTWPHHLARLASTGKLELLDLEGNPCMDALFKRSAEFRNMYVVASTTAESDDTESLDLTLKRTKSTTSSASVTTASTKRSLFRRAKPVKVAPEPELDESDEDDMLTSLEPKQIRNPGLRKYSSSNDLLSKYLSENKDILVLSPHGRSTRSNSGSSPSRPSRSSPETLQSLAEQELRMANELVTPVERAKSVVVLGLLRDIYQLANGTPPTAETEESNRGSTSPSEASFSASVFSSRAASISTTTTTSMDYSHGRVNSMDVLQHYLEDKSLESYDSSAAYKVELDKAKEAFTKLVEQESRLVADLTAHEKIYISKDQQSIRAAKIFVQMPEIRGLHTNTVLPMLQAAQDRINNGQDPHLEFMAHTFLTIIKVFELYYLSYANHCEMSKRQARQWVGLKRSSAPIVYGGNFPGCIYADHPECDLGEWLRTCANEKAHTYRSIINYLQAPLLRLSQYCAFFDRFAPVVPALEPVHMRFTAIQKEVNYRIPLEIRSRRWKDVQSTYRLSAYSKPYICDANVTIISKVKLEDVGKGNKTGDVMCQSTDATDTRARNVPKRVEYELYDPARPPKGSVLRMIVLEDSVVFANEAKRTVAHTISKSDIHASIIEEAHRLPTPGPNERGNLASHRTALTRSFRVNVYPLGETWYLNVRTFSGDRVGATVKDIQEDIIKAISSTR